MTSEQPARVIGRGEIALAVAAAVDATGFVRRTGGNGVEIATYYAGGKVLGVKLGGEHVTVHVVALRLPLDDTARVVHVACRHALEQLSLDWPVEVAIDDLDVDGLATGRVR
jgi:hypothetical protein